MFERFFETERTEDGERCWRLRWRLVVWLASCLTVYCGENLTVKIIQPANHTTSHQWTPSKILSPSFFLSLSFSPGWDTVDWALKTNPLPQSSLSLLSVSSHDLPISLSYLSFLSPPPPPPSPLCLAMSPVEPMRLTGCWNQWTN